MVVSDEKNSKKNYGSSVYAQGSALGKTTEYVDQYSPQLLHAISRQDYRATIKNSQAQQANSLVNKGRDIWHAYELSYLQPNGLPRTFILRLSIPANSPNIIESKSLKLYLNSFSQTVYQSSNALLDVLQRDLDAKIDALVDCELFEVGGGQAFTGLSLPLSSPTPTPTLQHGLLDTSKFERIDLDQLNVDCNSYQPNADLLKLDELAPKQAFITSHLLRSNCPITNQPDWASLSIVYSNTESDIGLSAESLLEYIVSYRQHNGFHEQTVEQIFVDLKSLGLERLLVCAQYTRRGGIDINPIRTTGDLSFAVTRVNRQ